jgi:hypothetical protein
VSRHPELAGKEENVGFARGRSEHLEKHGGDWRNESTGELVDRSKLLGGASGVIGLLNEFDSISDRNAHEVPLASKPGSILSFFNPVNDITDVAALVEMYFSRAFSQLLDESQKTKDKQESKSQNKK